MLTVQPWPFHRYDRATKQEVPTGKVSDRIWMGSCNGWECAGRPAPWKPRT